MTKVQYFLIKIKFKLVVSYFMIFVYERQRMKPALLQHLPGFDFLSSSPLPHFLSHHFLSAPHRILCVQFRYGLNKIRYIYSVRSIQPNMISNINGKPKSKQQ